MGKRWVYVSLVSLLLLGGGKAEGVIELNDEKDLDEILHSSRGNGSVLMLNLLANWCGHCSKLKPELDKAAEQLQPHHPSIRIARVDLASSGNEKIARRFAVRSYPTIKLYFGKTDEFTNYSGSRDASSIVQHLKKRAGPPSSRIDDAATASELLNASSTSATPAAVLGIFANEHSGTFKAFEAAASALVDEVDFIHTTDASILPSWLGALHDNDVVAIRLWDTDVGVTAFSGSPDVDSFKHFARSQTLPSVAQLTGKSNTRATVGRMFDADSRPKVFAFANASDAAVAHRVYSSLQTLASDEDLKQELHFIFVDPEENSGPSDYFGIKLGALPAMGIHDGTVNKKFIQHHLNNTEQMEHWLRSFLNNEVEASIMSEEKPAEQRKRDEAENVVANEFNEKVLDADRDVLLMLYTPSCPHCLKALSPLDECASKFADDINVRVARMNVQKNDVPQQEVAAQLSGVPTFVLVSSGQNTVIPYSGDRSASDLARFITEHRKSSRSTDEL